MNLYDALTQYSSTDAYPFHMPGHKRRAAHLCDPALSDITEIDGFDNLHHAEGILKEAQERAAALYGSSETHFLVNGSTAGILSAIGACTRPDSCLLMARSSHRSAYNAAALNRVRTAWLYDPVDPAQVEAALERQTDVCALVLTSPSYDGVVCDVERIAQIAHSHGVILIVDEAHGAHFGMHPCFPESSVKLGADLVIHSLHKTLPALTQTALLHVNGPLADRRRLRYLLSVYQTSSPSYVLMASMDQCIRLLSEQKDTLFAAYADRLWRFYERTKLSHYSFRRTDDPSRILICPPAGFCSAPGEQPSADDFCSALSDGTAAMQLYHTLRERFHLQPEMVSPSHVLMLSSVCDDEEGFRRLSDALLTLDREFAAGIKARHVSKSCPHAIAPEASFPPSGRQSGESPQTCCTIAAALEERTQAVPFSDSAGYVSAEFLMRYPPGVPLLVPGERITEAIIRRTELLQKCGYSMQGMEDHSLRQIRVISDSHMKELIQ